MFKAIKTLRSLGLGRFVREKPELDKDAILKEPDAVKGIKGISVSQHERFSVKPSNISVEIERDAVKLRQAV